eukprot:2596301-Prymnesium_polylepis.1
MPSSVSEMRRCDPAELTEAASSLSSVKEALRSGGRKERVRTGGPCKHDGRAVRTSLAWQAGT